ncbi:MAG: 2OG-Fe(II) oxygenase [Gammaproteobacteria bacterium]|nr:2OG-Fe(II) oxygenase [Gammaproteobacteria bacterium]
MTANADPGSAVDALVEHGWVSLPHWLPDECVSQLRQLSEANWRAGRLRHAGVGRGAGFRVLPEVRGDRVLWLDDATADAATADFLASMEGLRLAFNRALYLGLDYFEAHLTMYPPGARYRPHLDHFRNSHHRVVSSVLYLNAGDWACADGGQLRLYLGSQPRGEHVDILPCGGTMVLFLSQRFWHEVLPAGRDRWSITGWFCRRPTAQI